MVDISASTIILPSIGLIVGLLAGWVLRGSRVERETNALHAGWREKIETERLEQERVAAQNRSLMEQVSQYRASRTEADDRTRELSNSLREALAQCQRVKADLAGARRQAGTGDERKSRRAAFERRIEARLREKDGKIFALSRELESWQNRLPPLVEKYRESTREAERLATDLSEAKVRIQALEDRHDDSDETRIEPVDDAALTAAMEASNERYGDGSTSIDIELPAPADRFATDTLVQEGTLDFDLGNAGGSPGMPAPDPSERKLNEVFEADAGTGGRDDEADADEVPVEPSTTLEDGCISRTAALGRDGRPDDLQRIRGVGPAIEKTLNDFGIKSFSQIAGMTEAEIDQVARELRGFRSRIYREDWIGQARVLQHDPPKVH